MYRALRVKIVVAVGWGGVELFETRLVPRRVVLGLRVYGSAISNGKKVRRAEEEDRKRETKREKVDTLVIMESSAYPV